jgi:hypothetical protein
MRIIWKIMRMEQIDALNVIADEVLNRALVLGLTETYDDIIVVTPVLTDLRRWDIDIHGEITRRDRETHKPVRGNVFPKRIMKTAS